jgi:hypothetical protein
MAAKSKSKSSTKSSSKKSSKRSSSRSKKNQPVNRSVVGGDPNRNAITVTSNEARNDSDALYGHFARVTKGEHQGRYGVVESFVEHGSDGYPTKAILRTRDDDTARLTVPYDALERTRAGGR